MLDSQHTADARVLPVAIDRLERFHEMKFIFLLSMLSLFPGLAVRKVEIIFNTNFQLISGQILLDHVHQLAIYRLASFRLK